MRNKWKAVHATEMKQYLKCRLAWYWSAPPPRGLGLEPNRPAPALHLGSLVHSALQLHYDQGENAAAALTHLALEDKARREKLGDLWPEQIEMMMENAALGAGMLRGYEQWAKPMKVVATETQWNLPLVGRTRMAGTFDLVTELDDGLWVLDFKTSSRTQTDWTVQDLQATIYVWAARQLYGPDVRGIVFRFLRKKLPLTYDDLVLKSGKLTKKKSLPNTTTFDEYNRALEVVALEEISALTTDEAKAAVYGGSHVALRTCEEFQDAHIALRKEHWDLLQTLRATPNPFFWDVKEYRTETQVRRHFQYVVIPAAKEMVSRRKGRWIGPTGVGSTYNNCGWCSFKEPCQAWGDGADFQSLLREDYRKQERYETT